ncbi:diaminohydroxyphosphoribosylaminopyrimidine deaminase [Ulvibacter sp. MAR_2010_11]|nr:diaminohydroxyphosphoribosylaminopyrimidine deaminase [Ulvibacter sp. MAR_2010_11]
MKRCLQLAANGLGSTYPNPMVGCVVVYDNQIIGEGWHYKAGLPHAEVNAITSVVNKDLLRDAVLYVSLEPCSHFGKTPPCADLIISSGIKQVVIGSTDPNPKVAGSGIKKLIAAGCDVVVGVLEEACDELNKRFFTYHQQHRPYIFLKWAQTQDGLIAPSEANRSEEKEPVWITNNNSRQRVHKMRAEEQSILVGTTTVLRDNPSLTTREWTGPSPVRVVLDRNLQIPKTASVFDGSTKTIVLTEQSHVNNETLYYETIDFSEGILNQICDVLYKHKIQSVIVEGGAETLQTFLDANCWDEAFVFTGNVKFGEGVTAPMISGSLISEEKIGNDTLQHFKPTRR